ncbi:MAG TPA: cytochrome c [Acidisarcina sp.]|nr:cytochrome c [Acidisarcina sp.]
MRRRTFKLIAINIICLTLGGCRVSTPGKREIQLMQWIKHHLTVGNRQVRNPMKDDAESLEMGKHAFGFYCVVCHGADGQNTGVPFAARMSPPVPSLASQEVQSYSDGQLKWVIENGVSPSGMPASRGILSDEDMWAIVLYLRHLPPSGSLGEPRIYTGNDDSTDR